MLIPRLAAPVLMIVSLGLPALADDAAEIARQWGLIGTWAVDCAKSVQPGHGNVITYEVSATGRLIYRRDLDAADTNEVTDVQIDGDHSLVLSITMPRYSQTRDNGIDKLDDGSIRSTFNRGRDGSYTIRDGRFVATGKPTPRLRKCD